MTMTQIQERIQAETRPTIDTDKFLQDLINRKKEWKPFPLADVEPNPFTQKQHLAIQKCLALALGLELPVGDLALDGASWVDSQNYKAALTHNAIDELTHYEAFEVAAVAYDMPNVYQDQVYSFSKEFEQLGEHPVLLAGYLELSIFFTTLAMMRKYGSPGLKQLVAYVNRDESVHVNVNMYIVDKLNLGWVDKEAFNTLREQVITWLTSSLPESEKQQWLDSSRNLFDTRKAPELNWTKTGQNVAFFEVPGY